MARAKGANAYLSAKNFGWVHVRVVQINHGMRVVAQESIARRHRVFYPMKETSGAFAITMIFSDHVEYQKFGQWMAEYARRIASPNTKKARVGPMRVTVPVRNFDKTGVPSGSIEFGQNVRAASYTMSIQFEGTRDSIDATRASTFVLPRRSIIKRNPEIPHFYPAGRQLSGDRYGKDYLYDQEQSLAVEVQPPDPRHVRGGTE